MGVDDLFVAIAAGDAAQVSALIAADASVPRAKDANSVSVLQFARYMGQTAILASLVEAGPPLDVFEAAQIDAVDCLRDLLDADPGLASAFSAESYRVQAMV